MLELPRSLLIGYVSLSMLSACAFIESPSELTPDPPGSGGGSGGCSVAADCAAVNCQVAACNAGVCEYDNEPAGSVAAMQTPGDCQRLECDGNGAEVSVVDDSDLPDDLEECTIDVCDNGTAQNVPKLGNTPCTGGTCDDFGHCIQCLAPSECPGTDDFCQQRTCIDFKCNVVFEAANAKLPPSLQIAGDCSSLICDGNGEIVDSVDDLDTPMDGFECTQDVCSSGTPSNPDEPQGTACMQDGGKVCTAGACVECVSAANCMTGQMCDQNFCVSPGCTNNVLDGNETDVDCGGSMCAPCAVGQNCMVGSDCLEGVCGSGNNCAAPSCSDGVANGSESDIDCGGSCSTNCPTGGGCVTGADCQSLVCQANICQAPSCSDGVQNGSETDDDCGSNCPDCNVGKTCMVHADCTTGRCQNGTCILLNGCDRVTAQNLTNQSSVSVIVGSTSETYNPKCYIVTAGTAVTYYGNFQPHPQSGGAIIGNMVYEDAPSVNPFSPEVNSGSMHTYTLSTPGAYGVYCTKHWAGGYGGAAYVVP